MSLTMDKISSALTEQFNELPWGDHLSHKSFQMEIENVDVKITIFMHRTRILDIHEDKVFANDASIHIELPEDKQERKAVRAHIDSQLETNLLESKQFDPFTIIFVKGSQAISRKIESHRKDWEAKRQGSETK